MFQSFSLFFRGYFTDVCFSNFCLISKFWCGKKRLCIRWFSILIVMFQNRKHAKSLTTRPMQRSGTIMEPMVKPSCDFWCMPGWRVRYKLPKFDVTRCYLSMLQRSRHCLSMFRHYFSTKTWLKISMTVMVEKFRFRAMLSFKNSNLDPCCRISKISSILKLLKTYIEITTKMNNYRLTPQTGMLFSWIRCQNFRH